MTTLASNQDNSAKRIRVSNASVVFEGQPIFTSLSFTAQAGQFTGILGPSGVGKTTLLKLIAGLYPATDLTTICDQNGEALTGHIAWMAQKDLLLPWLTVLENVCLGARLRGELHASPLTNKGLQSEIKDKACHLLATVGLEKTAKKYPDTLSGGMRQRVALARTLMEERSVILMDEPFSAVDPLTRISLQDLASQTLQGRTVVFVTHDPLEAIRIGHQVYVLSGTPATLREISLPHCPLPRPVDNSDTLSTQAEILRALAIDARSKV